MNYSVYINCATEYLVWYQVVQLFSSCSCVDVSGNVAVENILLFYARAPVSDQRQATALRMRTLTSRAGRKVAPQ